MTPWLSIVGLGEDGVDALPAPAQTLIANAEVLVGGERHLAMVDRAHPAERRTWESPFKKTVAALKTLEGKRVVVLATGDPMSYGIGVTLAREFGRDAVCVLPAPGAFSLAAARLGWPLQDIDCLTLHGRPLALLNLFIRPDARLLILSENGETPAQVAAALCTRGYGGSTLTVFEHMDGNKENARDGVAKDWGDTRTADLNTIAVACAAGPDAIIHSRVPGLPDEAFLNDGQLTKRAVRAATLAALAPQPDALLWDVGAGCGSVAIEWMRAGGKAVAIETKTSRCALIAQNAAALGTPTLDIVTGSAPSALSDLSPPDAVFIGGGIGTTSIAETCWDALSAGGRLVANAVTLESEAKLLALHEQWGGALTRIGISQAESVGRFRAWSPLRTVTQLAVTKP
ncbi:MAG: precorrin-6y C5,15-methyltransferase (decarboxylating) subunit CbiE [Alphaproteobacteria bacterium]|nr:precorrin-6y C5,15-methyltransferase (decarboxylating) subunit CbiE [Alphaproteobacteria bacterium]